MNALTSALRKLGSGFLYGAGFLLGVAVAAFFVLTLGVSIWTPQTGARLTLGSPVGPDPQLRADQFEFSNTNSVKTSWGGVAILGTVHNKGPRTGQYFQINADLFDQGDKFIFQCSTQVRDGLAKDEQANFKIDCHDAPKETAAQMSSFKVYARSQ